jgi:hypothetical protein
MKWCPFVQIVTYGFKGSQYDVNMVLSNRGESVSVDADTFIDVDCIEEKCGVWIELPLPPMPADWTDEQINKYLESRPHGYCGLMRGLK